jgi:hypothetical protein
MANKLVALSGAALALLILSAVGPAEARGGHGGHSHGVHSMGGAVHMGGPIHHHHFHHRVFVVGGPFAYGYYYGDGCYWLRRRALYTGSGYWWDRYDACINSY